MVVMSYRIGVLGSNGKVGTKLCDFLDRNNISFVKASRSGKKLWKDILYLIFIMLMSLNLF